MIDCEAIQKQLDRFFGPSKAGRLMEPPVTGCRVKDLVRAGKLDAIRTDLGLLIDSHSIARFQRERADD